MLNVSLSFYSIPVGADNRQEQASVCRGRYVDNEKPLDAPQLAYISIREL